MEANEINTLENRLFRLECEKMEWRKFRDAVESFIEMKTTFGTNSIREYKELKDETTKIMYL